MYQASEIVTAATVHDGIATSVAYKRAQQH